MKWFPILMTALVLSASASLAQGSDSESEDWYLWTDDGARLYVTEFGQAQAAGDTVIVLHGGWGGEHSYLLPAVSPFGDRYRFILYDQRGSLRSPAPDSLITFESMVADLDALREELGVEQLTLLGHSMGSALSYHYLHEHPDRVKGLVLIGPVAPVWGSEEWTAIGVDTTRRREAVEARNAKVEEHIATQIAKEGLNRDSLSSKERTHRWLIQRAGNILFHVSKWRPMEGGMAFHNDQVGRALGANASNEWSDWDAIRARQRATLEAFSGPIRVILGDFDGTDPEALVWPQLVKQFPTATLTVLEDAGHNAWIDQPEAFREALSQALEAATD